MEAKRRFNGKEKAGARAARVQSFVEVKSSLRQVLSSVEASGMPVDTRRSARPAVPPATRLDHLEENCQASLAVAHRPMPCLLKLVSACENVGVRGAE
eukprot:4470669-Prymnesium_polylepis.1